MIDPENISTDTELTLRLPRLISVDDYHEFGSIQRLIEENLGIKGVCVTEVGFLEGEYVALIHTDCDAHNQLVMELTAYYNEDE